MYIHRNFTHPGGVSPMKQEKVEEKKVEEKKKKKKAFDYSKKQDYSGGPSESVQSVMDFVTPQNNLELGLSAVGGFGAGMGRIGTKLLRTKVGQKVANKIPWLKSLTKPITKTAKGAKGTNTTKGDFDFSKKNDYSGGGKPKGGVDGGSIKVDKNYKYETFDAKTTPRSVTDVTNVKGTDLDGFVAKLDEPVTYTKQHITKLPNKSGRPFVKVDLPNGGEQIFYRSSGGGGKAGSKGEWIPFEGFRPGGWFVKTGSKGKFAGKNMETIFTYHNKGGDVISKANWIKQGKQQNLVNSHGVYEQIQQLGLDPWEEIAKGNLKIDKWGQGFKYGSKEYTKIAEQLKNMDL
tara:strand:+ start:130 stop:1170 length:1041 start_codon:yes stop_codon:yes gene_type:complete